MNKSEKYNSIKVIIMVIVVIAHTTRMYTNHGLISTLNNSYVLEYFTNFIYGFHMPIFILISGAVYYYCIYDMKKYKNSKKFILGKIKRLLVPYIIFGIFYVAPIMLIFKFTDNSPITYIFKGILLCTNSRHLWFLYYLFIYFMLYYFIFKNSTDNKLLIMINVLYIIIYLSDIPLISNMCFYAIFFDLGLLTNKYFERICTLYIKYKYFLVLSLLVYAYLVYIKVNNLILSLLGTLTFLGILVIIPNIKGKYFEKIKKNSMGIYLFHPMIIYICFYFLGNLNIEPLLLSTTIIIFAFTMSYILTSITRKIKLKFILGE